jgi:hypothetical protein
MLPDVWTSRRSRTLPVFLALIEWRGKGGISRG